MSLYMDSILGRRIPGAVSPVMCIVLIQNGLKWNNPVAVCQFKSRMENHNQAELSQRNLSPEVKCPGGKLLQSKLPPPPPPDTLLRSKLLAPDTLLRSKVTPLEVDCPPCEGTVCFEVKCPGDNLLRSRVSGGQLRSRVSGGQLTSK